MCRRATVIGALPCLCTHTTAFPSDTPVSVPTFTQCVSIAKAGIVCTLPARTCVIAAANPAGGHYNRAKTVSENIKISTPLLSRFDLIFILVDRPVLCYFTALPLPYCPAPHSATVLHCAVQDEELDHRLSEHVMLMHASTAATSVAASERGLDLTVVRVGSGATCVML
jgi:MCM2/3/5 family protein